MLLTVRRRPARSRSGSRFSSLTGPTRGGRVIDELYRLVLAKVAYENASFAWPRPARERWMSLLRGADPAWAWGRRRRARNPGEIPAAITPIVLPGGLLIWVDVRLVVERRHHEVQRGVYRYHWDRLSPPCAAESAPGPQPSTPDATHSQYPRPDCPSTAAMIAAAAAVPFAPRSSSETGCGCTSRCVLDQSTGSLSSSWIDTPP